MATSQRSTVLWLRIADTIDVPVSLYKKAVDRHHSLGEWLCRPVSVLAVHRPSVRPQGSFRYGTVVRPIDPEAEYDLDHVVVLEALTTGAMTQSELKALHGQEIASYAAAHGMLKPTEHNRCWRLPYRDEVAFHLDSLPAVPANESIVKGLREGGIDETWASVAIAITDRRHKHYTSRQPDWLTSNPRGFARWFEARAALGRDQEVLKRIRAGQVEDVPPYEWKTPLQRAIQILKRHRDVMFAKAPEIAPISMIITNLAASAYQGETDLTETLRGILDRMPNFVRPAVPRVPNPTHPQEDYADKWQRDPRLEQAFWQWHQQAKADIERFSSPLATIASRDVEAKFGVSIDSDLEARLKAGAPAIVTVKVATPISEAPKPWGHREE